MTVTHSCFLLVLLVRDSTQPGRGLFSPPTPAVVSTLPLLL